jgi:prophage tail gpP-like protein
LSEYTGPIPGSNDLTLTVGNTRISGWLAASVSRSIERFPSNFELTLTANDPDTGTTLDLSPGSSCTVQFGTDNVFTGWIERRFYRVGPGGRTVVVAGRSKACDLLCAVDLQGNSIRQTSLLGIAQKLAAPYGVAVTSLDGDGPIIPFVNFFITQKPYDIIAQIARYAQFLVYDGPDGNLVLARASTTAMASGFELGVNIEMAEVDYNIAERYSEYRCFIQSTDFLLDNSVPASQDPNRIAVVKDADSAIRHRVFSFVAEAGQNYRALALQQATWELNRRRGRSQAIRLVVDSWRDSSGALWEPNRLASISAPQVKIDSTQWLIADVTFRRDKEGTHADLVLMPPESFLPQPTNLYQFSPAVMAALAPDQNRASRDVIDGLQRRDR